MRMRLLTPTLLTGVVASTVLAGCARELTLEPKIDTAAVVVAQFDPTNPIPVLQIVPSPTGLAQRTNPDRLAVTPAPCELPSVKQCLAFVTGWPTTTPVTLFFSGELDEPSISQGIRIFGDGNLSPLPFSYTIGPRPAPPAACQDGDNGSNPPRTYVPAQVPPGIQVVITPDEPFEPGTGYVVIVESYEEGGVVKGLKAKDGKRVEPADLFFLMNTDTAPVLQDGTIPNALLRTNVTAATLDRLFPGKSLADLSAAEKEQVAAAVKATGKDSLFNLYNFFAQVLGPLSTAGVTSRDKVVFANAWRTAGAGPGLLEFDPAVQKIPFPNVELLTATTGPGLNDVKVSLPINPCGSPPTPGCDSPTAAALKTGLNTLTGFSTLAPMSVSANRAIDTTTLQDNVVVYQLNDQGAITGDAIPVAVRSSSTSTAPSVPIVIQPLLPLEQNTTYVVGIKRGIKNTEGGDIDRSTTFTLLTAEEPLVVGGEFNTNATVDIGGNPVPVSSLLQCSTVSTQGRLATDAEVLGSALAIETQLKHARWQAAIQILDGAPTPIPASDLLMAFTYKTQAITNTMDAVKGQLLPTVYEQIRTATGTPRIAGPLLTVTGYQNILNFLDVSNVYCVALCQAGAMAPQIPANMCTDANGNATPQVAGHPLCGAAGGLIAGRLHTIRLYLMANYRATDGNPYANGGTFSQQRVLQPTVIQTPVWVVTATGAVPADGQPVVIFQHGLGRAKEDGFLIANSFAAAGWSTVLMDLPFHGSRASDIVNNTTGAPCPAVNPSDVVCDPSTGACVGGCDGEQDDSGTGFLSANVFAARDNFRQSTIDQLTLMRAIAEESDAAEPLSYLDGTQIAYAGQSLGGITGGNFLAYAPEVEAGVLNVAGGGLVNVLLNTVPQISGPLYAALAQAGVCTPKVPGNPGAGCKDTPGFRQFLVTAQWALDPGDPLANSIAVLRSHNTIPPLGASKVLVQMAVPDLVIPNSATRALGRSYGFNPDDNGTSSHFQTYEFPAPRPDTNCHGFILAPSCGASTVDAICATFGAQQQAARFIASGGTMVGSRSATLPAPLTCP
ncbi:MAG: hypothetical protein IT384_33505 [Deltaproteobacteria bacterium]|nr:hypothetical protein [Deltaproteobacteria bacterium]